MIPTLDVYTVLNHLCYLADASKSGVAQETLQNAARRAGKVMTEQEARQILGISEETTWEEVLKASIFLFSLLSSWYPSHIHVNRILKHTS